jgi:hypothetical protein
MFPSIDQQLIGNKLNAGRRHRFRARQRTNGNALDDLPLG